MKAQSHITLAQNERTFYKEQCDESRADLERAFPDAHCTFPHSCTSLPNSKDMKLHISFDFAQQVHYPSNPLQPGPIYFLTPRKCGIFGVCREGIQLQVNK